MPSSPLRPIPVHVAIFMDGNGRWAKARGLPRTEGHREGLNTAKRIVKTAEELGIRVLTLYVFSTENWKRTSDEVGFLMGLIKRHLSAEFDFYRDNGIKVVHSGDPAGLPLDVLEEIKHVERDTCGFNRITINLAINYGGRDEIVRAAKRALLKNQPFTETTISGNLDHPELPDVDLIVRPGGELRLSNFLLWESAYAELLFVPKLWPDFEPKDLVAAIEEYRCRNRRFGGTL